MKIGSKIYLSVVSIKLYSREIRCSVLPAYYCTAGCDTISHRANIGQVRHFQKLIKKQAFHLLENLGSQINYYKDVEHAKRFFQTIMYFGLPGESITQT